MAKLMDRIGALRGQSAQALNEIQKLLLTEIDRLENENADLETENMLLEERLTKSGGSRQPSDHDPTWEEFEAKDGTIHRQCTRCGHVGPLIFCVACAPGREQYYNHRLTHSCLDRDRCVCSGPHMPS